MEKLRDGTASESTNLAPTSAELDAALRRARRRYWPILAVIVLAVIGGFVFAVQRGEISHVTLRTATSAAPTVKAAEPSSSLTVAWQSTDATAAGDAYLNGTVVTYSAHTVTGRDALSGNARWSFTRSDRDLCSVVQESGKTVALFRSKGDCDELTVLQTGTGERLFERTIDDDGDLLTGTPVVLPGPDAIIYQTDTEVRGIRLSDGLDSWVYVAPSGCQNLRSVRGSSGVLITQHCADGDYLLLRDLYASDLSDTNKTNPVHWRIKVSGVVPAAADAFVAVLNTASKQLQAYDAQTGSVTGSPLTLSPTPSPLRPILQSVSASGELIWVGDTVYAVDKTGTTQQWSSAAVSLPVFSGPSTGSGGTDFSTLAVPTGSGVSTLDPDDGSVLHNFAVPAPSAGSRVIRLGSGFLVAGTSTTVYQ